MKDYFESPEELKCIADNGKWQEYYGITYWKNKERKYEYIEQLGGKRVGKSFLTTKLKLSESQIHVIYDYRYFYRDKGKKRL